MDAELSICYDGKCSSCSANSLTCSLPENPCCNPNDECTFNPDIDANECCRPETKPVSQFNVAATVLLNVIE